MTLMPLFVVDVVVVVEFAENLKGEEENKVKFFNYKKIFTIYERYNLHCKNVSQRNEKSYAQFKGQKVIKL